MLAVILWAAIMELCTCFLHQPLSDDFFVPLRHFQSSSNGPEASRVSLQDQANCVIYDSTATYYSYSRDSKAMVHQKMFSHSAVSIIIFLVYLLVVAVYRIH